MTHSIDRYDHLVGGESIIWKYDVEKTDGTDKDLTSATIDWYLLERRGNADSDALLDKGDSTVAVRITDEANGVVEVELDPDATKDLAGGMYWQRLVATDNSGNKQVWTGEFPIQTR